MRTITTVTISILLATYSYAATPWEQYLALPTPANASKVSALGYSAGAIPPNYGYWAPDLDILKIQILGGDQESFRLAYRLIERADGGLLEELTAMLGQSIRPQPEMFLRQLGALKPDTKLLKSILLNTSEEYVDRESARIFEIEMRKKALQSVADKSVVDIKAKCLNILQN
jgi:hypothetical protein